MTKNSKRLARVDVTLATGQGESWTRASDGLAQAALTETNVLMILDDEGKVLMMYSPMTWLSAQSQYEEVVE